MRNHQFLIHKNNNSTKLKVFLAVHYPRKNFQNNCQIGIIKSVATVTKMIRGGFHFHQ